MQLRKIVGEAYEPQSGQPSGWILIFNPKTDSRFVRLFCIGKFKHVAAIGWVAGTKSWITFDVGMNGTRVSNVPSGQEDQLAPWLDGCTLVAMPRKHLEKKRLPMLGWCVPSIKQLIGLRSSALRPDALYRHCLRDGGEVISKWVPQQQRVQAVEP